MIPPEETSGRHGRAVSNCFKTAMGGERDREEGKKMRWGMGEIEGSESERLRCKRQGRKVGLGSQRRLWTPTNYCTVVTVTRTASFPHTVKFAVQSSESTDSGTVRVRREIGSG